jgi:hypothetical protein
MHGCINCGRSTATRQGDTFTCGRCGHSWDVAHELANAAFLRTQGRLPASPTGEESDGVPGVVSPLEDLAQPVKFDVLPALEQSLGAPLPEFDPAVQRDAAPVYEALTVDELKVLAAERGIDLTGRTRKAEIIAALRDAEA